MTTQAMGVSAVADDDMSQPVLKLIAFVLVVVVLGALLAPPLYAAAQWGIAMGFLPSALAAFAFPKYVTRAMLIVAVALIWPFVRWLGVRSTAELGLRANVHRARDFGLGAVLGIAGLFVAAVVMLAAGRAEPRSPLPVLRLFEALGTAITVALLEEWLFRGVLFGLARRTSPWPRALVVISLVFAVLHFVRAPPQLPVIDTVHWYSGLVLVPAHLWQFGEPTLLVGSLPTYFLVGAALAYATAKTSSLALAIGLHSGWVFALRGFAFLTRRVGEPSLWLGADLIGGVVPALLVGVTWAVLWIRFRKPSRASFT